MDVRPSAGDVALWDFVQPGDVLLVDGSSLVSWLIHVKTWDKQASHCEVVSYIAPGREVIETFTARGGQDKGTDGRGGVNIYRDLADWQHTVTMVLRPLFPFDANRAVHWARTVAVGQRYDYVGLLVFTLAVKQGAQDRMFCSEAVTRFLRAGGGVPFPIDVDADRVAPTTFRYSTAFAHHQAVASRVTPAG